MEKIKKIIKPENILSFFIILCPILDIMSFMYRKQFETNYSISTFVRPMIPIAVLAYVFLKQKNNNKLKIIRYMQYICNLCNSSFIYIQYHEKTVFIWNSNS